MDSNQVESVTIGGHRFTLAEVERTLQDYGKVRAAVAAVQRVGDEDKLIAYIVAEGLSPTVNQLRSYLQDRVPAHMIPSVFVALDRLPLASDGSVDRAALPPPNPVWSAAEQSYVPPRNGVEAAMAQLWAEVLLLDRVGIHDDFLEIGGDSLLGTQLVAKLFEKFGTEIPLESLFEHGTIAEIAEAYFSDAPNLQAGV
jgi:acyl carrier protein